MPKTLMLLWYKSLVFFTSQTSDDKDARDRQRDQLQSALTSTRTPLPLPSTGGEHPLDRVARHLEGEGARVMLARLANDQIWARLSPALIQSFEIVVAGIAYTDAEAAAQAVEYELPVCETIARQSAWARLVSPSGRS